MYKSFTAAEFRKFFNLPEDYKVDGLLSYGAWDTEKHIEKIKQALKDLNIPYKTYVPKGFLSYVLELNINDKRYWFIVMYGGALLSEMVHLACLFGSKKNIHIGSCGGLYPEVNDMDLILPTFSYGNESTTRTYEPNATDFKHYPDQKLLDLLENKISKKYKVWKGPIMTNQAMMGETWDDIKKWSEDGFYGVEMEAAAVFSVSKHFSVPSTALLYVSDNLIKGQTVGDESHIQQKTIRNLVKNDVYKFGIQTLLE